MTYQGDDILRFIPQRNPFVMVDEFEPRGDQEAVTALTIPADCYFLLPDGTMAETGLVEHMAQSCSALAGYKAAADSAPIGIIGEVRHFVCHRRPLVAERLTTHVAFGFSFGQVTMAHCTTTVGDELVAETDLKIFMQ